VLGGFSALIQIIGIVPPVRQYYVEMTALDPSLIKSAAIWEFKSSAPVWHMRWLLGGNPLDLAVTRLGTDAIPIALGFVVIIAFMLFGLVRPRKRWIPYLNIILVFGMIYAMLSVYRNDPEYYLERRDLRAAQERISGQANQDDLVIVKSYNTPVWYYWMNWADPDPDWISLPFYFPKPSLIEEHASSNDPEVALDQATLKLLKGLPSNQYQRVWLLLPSDTPGATLNIELDWLIQNSTLIDSWSFLGDQDQTQLFLFDLAGK
jgi:hypothetical protein